MNHAESKFTSKLLATLLLATIGFYIGGAIAADAATIARDTPLRDKPFNDAAIIAQLKAKAAVSVQSRTGAWAQINTTDGKNGYVRLLNLRTSSGQKGAGGVGALASVFRTGSSGTSVATGVKGLSEENLTGAEANPAEVEKLAAWTATDAQARSAAKSAGLKARTVEYLSTGGDDQQQRDTE